MIKTSAGKKKQKNTIKLADILKNKQTKQLDVGGLKQCS